MTQLRTIPTSSRDRKRPDTEAAERLDLDANESSAAAAADCKAGFGADPARRCAKAEWLRGRLKIVLTPFWRRSRCRLRCGGGRSEPKRITKPAARVVASRCREQDPSRCGSGRVRARMAVASPGATIVIRRETLMNETRQRFRAKVGDVVAIHGHHLGEPERLGEILEILGSAIMSIFASAGMTTAKASCSPAATQPSAFTDKSER